VTGLLFEDAMIAVSPLESRVEEVCLNAWPALLELHYDGWLLRFGNGLTRRSNSVNVIRPGVLELTEKVLYCERAYRAQGLPPIFRILQAEDSALDNFLDARGYAAADETSTLYADLGDVELLSNPPTSVELHVEKPSADWLAARMAFQQLTPQDGAKLEKILGALAIPAVFASVRGTDGRIASIAKGAVHNGIVCLNLVATDPASMRQGFSRACVTAILNWARREHGARGACLQVMSTNAGAIALYRGLGFAQELYRYHYRIQRVPCR
jgi:ribosomal protein S18 acetylase RimI-like enzyme